MAKGPETPQGKSAVSWAGHTGPPGCLLGQRRPVAAKIGLMLASGCSVKCVRCVQCVDMHGVDMFFWAGSVGNYLLCFAGREESGACLAVQY